MADNVVLNPGTGGDTTRSKDRAGVETQIVGIDVAIGTATESLMSPNAGLPVAGSQSAMASVAWTSATGANTSSTISIIGYNTVTVALSNTSTMTAGVLTFEVSPDNTNWFPIAMARIDSYTVETTYTLNVVANRAWSTSVDGWTNFRVRLSTAITGTGTANVFIIAQAMAIEPIVAVGQLDPSQLNATISQRQMWSNAGVATAVPGTATGAYAIGDQFGGLITIANAARVTGSGGFITGITFSDADDLITGLDIYFFHDTPTLAGDNAAWSLADSETDKILWIAKLTFFEDLALNKVSTQLMGISIPYFCTATSLYAAVRIQTAYTLAATSSPKYRFALIRD